MYGEVRDKGIDSNLVAFIEGVLDGMREEGHRKTSVAEIRRIIQSAVRHGVFDKEPTESEIRRALQVLAMTTDRKEGLLNLGPEMNPIIAKLNNPVLSRKTGPTLLEWSLKNRPEYLQIPSDLDSNLTLGLGQN